jgi:predicted house-cleaning NTP pyrophosphatase (Maf/HAM1 superfamily)
LTITAAPLLAAEEEQVSGVEVCQQVGAILAGKLEAARMELRLAGHAGMNLPDAVLVADTMVEDPDDTHQSLGKPDGREQAATMLLRLSGRRHLVWSGTALLTHDAADWISQSWIESATVEVDELSVEVLLELLDSDSWKGKAGAYDLAGMMGAHARLISGDEVCVLGFALSAVEKLEAWLDSGVGEN